jgi:hypothetical protein
MRRNLKVALILFALILTVMPGAQAQYTALTSMRQVNAQHNDQNRFIDVVHHFYTANWSEAVNAYQFYGYYFTGTVARGWSGPGPWLKPVYRLYRPSTGSHYYTSDWSQVQQLQYPGVGFTYEGIAMYVSTYQRPGTYPLYRVDRNYKPAQYFLWWQTAPEVPETYMLTMRSSDVSVATWNYGFTTNQYYGYLIGYANPGNLGVD